MTHKQTAMRRFGVTTWPASHVRSKADCDCRGYACVLMRDAGMSYPEIARDAGFADHTGAVWAVSRYKALMLKEMSHMDALLSCFNQLKPTRNQQGATQ